MGYTSEVRSLVYGPPECLSAMHMHWLHTGGKDLWAEDCFGWAITERIVYGPDQTALMELHAKCIKWYAFDEGTDSHAWEEFMRTAERFGCIYEFVRIGEESGDMETETTATKGDWLRVVTSVENEAPSGEMMRSQAGGLT